MKKVISLTRYLKSIIHSINMLLWNQKIEILRRRGPSAQPWSLWKCTSRVSGSEVSRKGSANNLADFFFGCRTWVSMFKERVFNISILVTHRHNLEYRFPPRYAQNQDHRSVSVRSSSRRSSSNTDTGRRGREIILGLKCWTIHEEAMSDVLMTIWEILWEFPL
jgi:hypothetical protein